MFHTIHHGTLEYLTADALSGSVHCFSTRFGGVSEGALSSLNLGTHRGDRPENVREAPLVSRISIVHIARVQAASARAALC